MPTQTSLRSTHPTRSAFSLVEMLVVIGILAIVISIVIPAVGGARRSAKNVSSRSTLVQLRDAIDRFETDKKRLPGYFSPRQMGAAANAATGSGGFDSCSNMMLDLIGGVTSPTASGANILTFGPGTAADTTVKVDINAMGATQANKTGAVEGNYFTFDQKRFAVQSSGLKQRMAAGNDNEQYPALVDAFGQPILAWVQDDIPNTGPFTAKFAPTGNNSGSRFYWAQNAAFLDKSVTALGKNGESQAYADEGSLLALLNSDANILATMEGLLGNPTAPDETAPAATPHPLVARGSVVLHSAGADGVYVGKRDRGGRGGSVPYEINKDKFNGPLFDDVIQAAGH